MTVCAKVQALVVIYESIFTLLVLLRMIKVMLFTFYQMLWRAPPCKNSNIFFTSPSSLKVNSTFPSKLNSFKVTINNNDENWKLSCSKKQFLMSVLKIKQLLRLKMVKKKKEGKKKELYCIRLWMLLCHWILMDGDHLSLSANEQLCHMNSSAIKLSGPAERIY